MTLLAFLSLLAACAGGGEPAGPSTLRPGYGEGGFRWAEGGVVRVFAEARETDGRVAICGAWTVEGDASAVSRFHEDVLQAGRVTLVGRTVLSNLGFMTRLPAGREPEGAPVACRRTEFPWLPGMGEATPGIEFPRMSIGL